MKYLKPTINDKGYELYEIVVSAEPDADKETGLRIQWENGITAKYGGGGRALRRFSEYKNMLAVSTGTGAIEVYDKISGRSLYRKEDSLYDYGNDVIKIGSIGHINPDKLGENTNFKIAFNSRHARPALTTGVNG